MSVPAARLILVSVLLLVAAAPWHQPAARAQAELLPAVQISTGSLVRETWPGDFDEDGVTDLVGMDPESGRLAVHLSRTQTSIVSSLEAYPIYVADLNRDGLADVIARGTAFETTLLVLRGNGDGTFTVVTTFDEGAYTFALVADFDGDGHRDLAVGEEGLSLHIIRGFGDFSFAPRVTLTTSAWPHGGIVDDFNGDGLPDIAVASRYEWQVDIFINGGGLLFTSGTIDTDRSATDVTARDVNGDTHIDLAVSVRGDNSDGPYADGFVYVYLGAGDGTFAEAARYPTAPGPHSVVFGDFTRDGRLDIATANHSAAYYDDCAVGLKNVDSVSILPGLGDGTFGAHTSFALSSQRAIWEHWQQDLLQNEVASLNTSDMNGDGHTDLIASHGIVLTNEAPRPNRPPTADAGDDWRSNSYEILIRGGGSDPDGHFLTFAWMHDGGLEVPDHPFTCLTVFDAGSHTFTLTVDDGRGGVSADSVVFTKVPDNVDPIVSVTAPAEGVVLQARQPYELRWTSSDSDGVITSTEVAYSEDDGLTWTNVPECDGISHISCQWSGPQRATGFGRILVSVRDDSGGLGVTSVGFSVRGGSGAGRLPRGWVSEDIGAAGAAGSAAYTTGTYTVRGSGADVWGTADELHFAHTTVSGDFDFISRVASVDNLGRWVKAGLMVREGTEAGARHAFAIVTPRTERGLAFQVRPAADGPTLHTPGPATAPPATIWLRRRADVIEAFYRHNEDAPWAILGQQQFEALAFTLRVGFGVSSHEDGTVAEALFDHVSLLPVGAEGFPEAWSQADVGAVGARGSTHYTRPVFAMSGSGADVWGRADELHFAYTTVDGDFDISTRVLHVEDLDRWVKAGLMVRESIEAGSRHAFAIATPRSERGLAFQRRPETDGASLHTPGPAWTPPSWLRLSRRGDTITAYYRRTMTDTWVPIATQTYSGLPARLLAGLAVTSHVDGVAASAAFEHVIIDPAISE